MALFFEKTYPVAFGAVIAFSYWMVFKSDTIPIGFKDLLSSFLNIASIIVGFLFTAQSILLSIDGKWIIQRAKESGGYQMLISYILAATRWWMVNAFLSAILLVVLPTEGALVSWIAPHAIQIVAFWVFVAATAALAAFRVMTVYTKILKSLAK